MDPRWRDVGAALVVLADQLDDVESARVRVANQYQSLTTERDENNPQGKGFAPDSYPAELLGDRLAKLVDEEKATTKLLEEAVREHPLGEWIASRKGIGEKTIGRLLAIVENPAWHPVHGRPRGLRELYAYCGMAVVDGRSPRRTRGVQGNWNVKARTRLFVIAQGAIKGHGYDFRPFYDEGRERYAEAVHRVECRNSLPPNPQKAVNGCGTKVHPEWGEVGTPWRPAHQDRGALRLVAKAVLRDMWETAREIDGIAQWDTDIHGTVGDAVA